MLGEIRLAPRRQPRRSSPGADVVVELQAERVVFVGGDDDCGDDDHETLRARRAMKMSAMTISAPKAAINGHELRIGVGGRQRSATICGGFV